MRLPGTATSAELFADVSDYQTDVRLRSYRRAGHRLIAIKAGEGLGTAGARHYHERVKLAHALGLRVWHYLFAELQESATSQVASLLRQVGPVRSGDRLVLDVETQGKGEAPAAWVAAALQELRRSGHPHPLAYSGLDWIIEHFTAENMPEELAWWVADYGRLPKVPDWLHMVAHQYTCGRVGLYPREYAGIGPCDGSRLTVGGIKLLNEEP